MSFTNLSPFSHAVPSYLDLQTKSERHQEIHRQTKCLHWCPVCRRTNQKPALLNNTVQQPSVAANG